MRTPLLAARLVWWVYRADFGLSRVWPARSPELLWISLAASPLPRLCPPSSVSPVRSLPSVAHTQTKWRLLFLHSPDPSEGSERRRPEMSQEKKEAWPQRRGGDARSSHTQWNAEGRGRGGPKEGSAAVTRLRQPLGWRSWRDPFRKLSCLRLLKGSAKLFTLLPPLPLFSVGGNIPRGCCLGQAYCNLVGEGGGCVPWNWQCPCCASEALGERPSSLLPSFATA